MTQVQELPTPTKVDPPYVILDIPGRGPTRFYEGDALRAETFVIKVVSIHV